MRGLKGTSGLPLPADPKPDLDFIPGVQQVLEGPTTFPVNVLQVGAYLAGMLSGWLISLLLIAVAHREGFDIYAAAFWAQVWGIILVIVVRWLYPDRGEVGIPIPISSQTLNHIVISLRIWANEPNLEFNKTKIPVTLLTGPLVGLVVAIVAENVVHTWGLVWRGFWALSSWVAVIGFLGTMLLFYFGAQGKVGVLKSFAIVFAIPMAVIAFQITLGGYAVLSALLVIAQITLVIWRIAPPKNR